MQTYFVSNETGRKLSFLCMKTFSKNISKYIKTCNLRKLQMKIMNTDPLKKSLATRTYQSQQLYIFLKPFEPCQRLPDFVYLYFQPTLLKSS